MRLYCFLFSFNKILAIIFFIHDLKIERKYIFHNLRVKEKKIIRLTRLNYNNICLK